MAEPTEGARLVEALLDLWTRPPVHPAELDRRIREIYTDPVTLNGTTTPLAGLIGFGRAMAEAFSDQQTELLYLRESDDQLAFAFRRTGRHTGTFPSSVGPLPATGREFSLWGVDILTVRDGRISGGWALLNELDLVRQLGAVVQGSG